MEWRMDHKGALFLTSATEEELTEARAAIVALGSAGPKQAVAQAGYLRDALDQRCLPWNNLKSLSRWCYTEGQRSKGIEPARRLSRALFGGRIIPRIATDEFRRDVDIPVARGMMRAFLADETAHVPQPNSPTVAASGTLGEQAPRSEQAPARFAARSCAGPGAAARGSQYCLQRWVNEASDELTDRILLSSLSLSLSGVDSVTWKSPLAANGYYEYQDDFLIPLGLDHHRTAVRAFWPERGPKWDALASVELDERPGVLLVEAKAYPGECASNCAAQNPASIARIDRAFARAQEYMGIGGVDWKRDVYQLANRLAFLYLMNVELQVPAWLVLIQFLNDDSHRPTSLREWRSGFTSSLKSLGLRPDSPLLDRVVPLWLEPR